MHKAITIGEFITLLWKGDSNIALGKAREHGWAEPQDIRLAGEALRRNDAARLIHEFLKRELGEADEENWDAAKSMLDLYDCHACVIHVAQVFCKGIMTAKGEAFGMRETVTQEEAREIAARVFSHACRTACGDFPAERLTATDLAGGALAAMNHKPRPCGSAQAILVDVRTRGEYELWHPDGAVNIPLLQLLENPETALGKENRPIILTCDAGYRAEIAAERLNKLGYKNVSYYGYDA